MKSVKQGKSSFPLQVSYPDSDADGEITCSAGGECVFRDEDGTHTFDTASELASYAWRHGTPKHMVVELFRTLGWLTVDMAAVARTEAKCGGAKKGVQS